MTLTNTNTNFGPGGRYAHLSRLIDEHKCCRFARGGEAADGIIIGLWTGNNGNPECVVLTADGRLNRVGLEQVRIRNAAVKVADAIEASNEKRRQRLAMEKPAGRQVKTESHRQKSNPADFSLMGD